MNKLTFLEYIGIRSLEEKLPNDVEQGLWSKSNELQKSVRDVLEATFEENVPPAALTRYFESGHGDS